VEDARIMQAEGHRSVPTLRTPEAANLSLSQKDGTKPKGHIHYRYMRESVKIKTWISKNCVP